MARFQAGLDAMSADERAAILAAMQHARKAESDKMLRLVTDIAAALGRTEARKESDKQTDKRRRLLIGARMPMKQALRCKACAALLGVSLYRFTIQAIERECRIVEAIHGLVWDGEKHCTPER